MKRKRILSFILSLAVCISFLPSRAYADIGGDFKNDTALGGDAASPGGTANEFETSATPVDYYALKNGSTNGQSGKVETFSFSGKQYKTYQVGVYLPYGYDPNDTTKAYNVIVYLQGQRKLNGQYEINPTHFLNKCYGAATCDYIISKGLAEPFIVFDIPERYATKDECIGLLLQNAQTKYNIYGSRFVPDDSTRNHYALIGISSGASYTISKGIKQHIADFGSFGICSMLSGHYISDDTISAIASSGLRINVALLSSGTRDDQYNSESKAYRGAKQGYPAIQPYADYTERWAYNGENHGSWKSTIAPFARFAALCYGGSRASSKSAFQFYEKSAFSVNAADTLQWFAKQYGWDMSKFYEAEWVGDDGNTYRRSQSHQLEHYRDALQSDIDLCIQLGILDETSGYNGSASSIVEAALKEAAASDNGETPPGSNLSKYNTWYYGKSSSAPWCAIFVSYCAYKAGLLEGESNCQRPLFKKYAGVKQFHNYFVNDLGFREYKGRDTKQLGGGSYNVKLGDLFCFWNSSESCYGHIGIVTDVTDDSFSVTQGNTGNGTNDCVRTIKYTASSAGDAWVGNGVVISMKYPSMTTDSIGAQDAFDNLTEDQAKLYKWCMQIAANPTVLSSSYRRDGYCAGFVQGVYKTIGLNGGSGNAIDYWKKWHASGSSNLSAIPIGAMVVGDIGTYGHIGIYVGHSMVIHYSKGGVCVWPLWKSGAYTEEEWSYITAHAKNWNGRDSFNNYSACWNGGWCWPNGKALGYAKDPTETK